MLIFPQVGVYLTKFSGECAPPLHRFKLNFLRTLCDHDFYVETPGRTTAEKSDFCPLIFPLFFLVSNFSFCGSRNYLAGVLLKEIFVSLGHDDLSLRNYVSFALLENKEENITERPLFPCFVQYFFRLPEFLLSLFVSTSMMTDTSNQS